MGLKKLYAKAYARRENFEKIMSKGSFVNYVIFRGVCVVWICNTSDMW
jgi:hypothetical protein